MSAGKAPCPLCASEGTRRLFTKAGVDYHGCRNCTFRFATPERNANLAGTLDEYEAAYLQYLGPDRSDDVNFAAVLGWMNRIARIDGARLLDIGTGSGKLVRYLRRRGIEAVGIEPSRALFDRFLAREAAFSHETVDGVAASGRTFPYVTAFDVIEHVPDPQAFLRNVRQVLEPGGLFFLSTPDVESLPARAFGRRWHFYYPNHLSYFGSRTLTGAAADHGLTLVDCRHRGRWRSVGYMVRYAAEFVVGSRAPAWARQFDAWRLPVNLFDTMYMALWRAT